MTEGRVLAVFDWDGTLAEGDCLFPFLVAVAGPAACALTWGAALGEGVAGPGDATGKDLRTRVKEAWVRRLLQGRPLAEVREVARTRLRPQRRWRTFMHATLERHHAAGHDVLIASGALDVCMDALLDDVPHTDRLCTSLETRDGILTGSFTAEGNCVRNRKAERVAAWIADHGPYATTWGYGNLPHDLPMLNLLDNRVVV